MKNLVFEQVYLEFEKFNLVKNLSESTMRYYVNWLKYFEQFFANMDKYKSIIRQCKILFCTIKNKVKVSIASTHI